MRQQLLLQRLLEQVGAFDAAGLFGNGLHQVHSGLDPDIRGDQQFFQFFQHVVVDLLLGAEQIIDVGGQNLSSFGEAFF